MKYKTKDICLVCKRLGWPENDLHHVKSRGAGGPDEPWNLMPLCRKHHSQVHRVGLTTFSIMHSEVKRFLKEHQWEFFKLQNKWIRDVELQREEPEDEGGDNMGEPSSQHK